jgi:hypothetical protein
VHIGSICRRKYANYSNGVSRYPVGVFSYDRSFNMSLYNCDSAVELQELRRTNRTEVVDTGDLTFKSQYSDMLEWQGYNVYVLGIDGNTAEVFMP